ncbi:hypothetical protein AMAG_20302 [Allomyces macrogynus ATCC 38327]|uniref:Uncharacterized protein n=1 Tax=Allomyces macrogynus (strain ATCC 38327) TaxID=578462 RepID=A0A0L0T7E2_ALLM3|nr:hypothetical protein AMAG_20302 [Allomyces macrogynus ATCC 38327]|eukprot:KNE70655.1 hypothetical protein AMAG_20302 [Allomyces macrogynus ATCC 38327]
MHFLTGPTADGSGSVASAAVAAPTLPDHASPYYHQHYQTAAAAAAAWAHADVYYTRSAPAPGPPPPVQQQQQQQAGHHHYLADPTTVGDYAGMGMGGYPRHPRVPVPVATATAAGGGNAWHSGGDGYGWLVGP